MELENHAPQHCRDFSAWLGHSADKPLNAHLADHHSGCPTCRGRLLTWMYAIHGIDPQPAISCAQCEADLGAFVERELADADQASRWYPAVWQHLWTCEDCLAFYDMLHQSLGDPALQLPDLASRQRLKQPAGRHLLDLMRAAITAVLDPAGPLPAYRSLGGRAPFEVLEPTLSFDGEIRCRIDAAMHADQTCRLIIRLAPAQEGVVVLHGATATHSARLANGEAEIVLPLQDLRDRHNDHFALFLLPDPALCAD